MNIRQRTSSRPRGRLRIGLTAVTVLASLIAAAPPATAAEPEVAIHTGAIDGAEFRVDVPADWNGTLLLYSHHYRYVGMPNPAVVTPSDLEQGPRMDGVALRDILLDQGYALAASAYATVGWSMEDALRDQPRLMDWFTSNVGKPKRVIAWGLSAGGLASMLLAQQDRRINGAVSLCADASGVVNQMNLRLDAAYVINVLLAGGELEVGRITDPVGNATRAIDVINRAAAGDPLSRARLLMAAAIANFPAQIDGHATAPVTDPYVAAQMVRWILINAHLDVTFGPGRKEIEDRAGGNPMWNVGVDYRKAFERSSGRKLVEQAYQAAGGNLGADLDALQRGPRVPFEPIAVGYMTRYGGAPAIGLNTPTMTLHTTVDAGAPVEHERVLAERMRQLGRAHLLRQAYTARGFTCSFSAAEVAVTIEKVIDRARTGRWGDTSAAALNAAVAQYPAEQQRVYSFLSPDPQARYATLPPAFVDYRPATLPRDPW